jgi:hypothetical protein
MSAQPIATPVVPRRRRRPRVPLLPASLLALFLLLAVIGRTVGGEPGGPASSSYATGARGIAAWAELLVRAGHPVSRLRVPIGRARLNPADTLVLLAPDAVLHSEGARLLGFVRSGGRLVFGAGDPRPALLALFRSGPEWTPTAPVRTFVPSSPAQARRLQLSAVQSDGGGGWRSYGGLQAPLRAGGLALLLERSIGKGRLQLLADDSPLQNGLLASAGNAQLGLDLAGVPRRPVVFVESVHGFGESRGLAALPRGWLVAFAGLILAGLLWAAARGRRLGAAEPEPEALAPPRGEYLDALALLLRRAGSEREIAEELEQMRGDR